jgi:hypothetical protein
MNVVTVQLLGGFGAQLFQYAFARAYAEKYGAVLECPHWVGREVFTLTDPYNTVAYGSLPARRPMIDGITGEMNVHLEGYMTNQAAMIYTREQVRRWFTIKPELVEIIKTWVPADDVVVAHRRTGDYIGNQSYPVISRASYLYAANWFGYDPKTMRFVEVEAQVSHPAIPGPIEFLPDFYRLMKAPVLFRGNSGFSWWAVVLGDHKMTFSPIVDGLKGGTEMLADFVAGNRPKIVDAPGVTDLVLL